MTSDSSGNYSTTGWEINIDNLPEDTMVAVKIGDLRNRLEWLMFRLGQYGFDVYVRYDTLRQDNNFTVQIGKYPRIDTNDPVAHLSEMLHKKERSER